MKKLAIIVLSLIIAITSCSTKNEREVWYICSDSYASMVIANSKENYLLIAYLDLPSLRAYRGALLKEGIESDDLGAIHSLFDYQHDYLVEGDKKLWETIYQDTSLSFEERVNYFIESGDDLSKMVKVDTLQSLAVKETTAEDMMHLYQLSKKSDITLRIYNIGLFFDKNGTPSLLRRNLHEWSKRAIEEIEREESK